MKSTSVHVLRAALFAAVMGCLALPAHAADVRPAIDAANAELAAAVAKGDAAAMSAMYAADAQVMPAGSEPIRGAAAIRKFWEGGIAGIGSITTKTTDLFAQGATATEVGQYELHDKAGKIIDHGKYIVVWRQEGAKWKILRDMFSTNVAPATK